MSGLPREVLRWIQSLELTWQIKCPKWDLTNGYLVAEIFSWYYPQEIQMHMYNTGTSLDSKMKNWSLLKIFFKRHNLEVPDEYIDASIHCKEGAAALLIEKIYEMLTNRQLRKVPKEIETDFTDRAYEIQLPMHARSTASKAVKNNLRITEIMADENRILSAQKAQTIINNHIEFRKMERIVEPKRFDKKPTLGERALRRAPVSGHPSESGTAERQMSRNSNTSSKGSDIVRNREPAVSFKEVQVKQMNKSAGPSSAIMGY